MQITTHSGEPEREILAALVLNETVLGRVAAQGTSNLFVSKWSNVVAGWCLKHFQKFQEAPQRAVGSYFNDWMQSSHSDEEVRDVDSFLSSLSGQYGEKTFNPEHILDIAGKHFNKVKLTRLVQSVQMDLDANELAKADALVTNYSRIELGVGAGVELYNDDEAARSTFDEDVREPLVVYRGALGDFFGRVLRRGGFISFLGPEKAGKSYWLLDVAFRALEQRRKVAYLQVGDLTEVEAKERFLVRAARHPLWPETIKIPTELTPPANQKDDKPANVVHKEMVFKEGLGAKRAVESCKKLREEVIRSKKAYFRLSCHPNYSLDVSGIRAILDGWERDGFLADVVVIDYADVIAPPAGYKDFREQTHMTWMNLRSLSMDKHILLVTATQSDAASYNVRLLTRKNFSEDKRKISHVTGIVGINVDSDEKENDQCRLNWVVMRERRYSWKNVVHVAGCLAIANPALKSCL